MASESGTGREREREKEENGSRTIKCEMQAHDGMSCYLGDKYYTLFRQL